MPIVRVERRLAAIIATEIGEFVRFSP